MADYLKCPLCTDFYNLKNKIPTKSQCGGVCCSSCTQNPCLLCENNHEEPPLEYKWLVDYIREFMIFCKCEENTAVFIDGKTFIPCCSSCKKSYQQGVHIDENLFKNWINSIFSHFLEQLNKFGNEGLLGQFFEKISKSLEIKLKCIRSAHQFFINQAYCEVHLEKKAKFLSDDLKFYCECQNGLTSLTEIEKCKEIVKIFVGQTGLLNQYLIDQLYIENKFSIVKTVFEARCMRRNAKITDVCPFCKIRFSQVFPVEVECENHDPKMHFILCNHCSSKTKEKLQELNINKTLFPCLKDPNCKFKKIEKKIKPEFSSTCSNCQQQFRIEYKTPLEQQPLAPFKLQCEHNICKACALKCCNNMIYCNICKQFYKFHNQINYVLLEAFNGLNISCPEHKNFFIEFYLYDNGFNFYCEKCKIEKTHNGLPAVFHISWIWLPVTANYKNILEFLEHSEILDKKQICKLRNFTIKKEMFENISNICRSLQFNHTGSIDLVGNQVNSLTDCEFCIKSSESIVLTGIRLALQSINGKLKVYIHNDGIFDCIFILIFDEKLKVDYYDLKCHGSIYITKEIIYKFEIIGCDGFDALRLNRQCNSQDGSVSFEVYLKENEIAQYSLIKSFNYETSKL